MMFETRIVRQNMPQSSVQAPMNAGYISVSPGEGAQQLMLVPPDNMGGWRYREMQILRIEPYINGYRVNEHGHDVPPVMPPIMELLVVWERHKENLL